MSYRTTFALDEATINRLKHLASVWHVSQAEVVRRALVLAEDAQKNAQPDPIAKLKALHAQGQGLDRYAADTYLAELRESRHQWRSE